jgi:hypothetical protein
MIRPREIVMKTIRSLALVILCTCLGCAGGAPPPQTSAKGPAAALDLLAARHPETKWKKKSLLAADLDQDGVEDSVLLGVRGDDFVVGIVNGPLKADSRIWTLEFPTTGGEDALCSQRVRIALESLAEPENQGPEPDHPDQGTGINLSDDLCDAFHIYWRPQRQRFEWWRL